MSKSDKEKQKYVQDKCQQILNDLLRDEDNKYCVDCDAKGPRWASWNLGIFLCIRCAGIHRNLGVHISKVKSINLDAWTPEQIGYIQQMGNSKARAVYEANLPDNFRRPQVDSALETFIRAKYEQKKYIAKEWVAPSTPPPAFNVEEERKREKEMRMKKSKTGNTSTTQDVQTNPLPRPISSPANTVINAELIADSSTSPKINHKSPSSSNTKNKDSSDLLELDSFLETVDNLTISPSRSNDNSTEDDPFDAFVSAPGVADKKLDEKLPPNGHETDDNKSKNDESDFFNQKQPEEKKLDKDSIMKLYETCTPAATLLNQPFNADFNQQTNQQQFMPVNPLAGLVQPQQQAANFLVNDVNNSNVNLFQNGHPIPQACFPLATNPFLASSLSQQNSQHLQSNEFLIKQQQQQQPQLHQNFQQQQLQQFDANFQQLNWSALNTNLPNQQQQQLLHQPTATPSVTVNPFLNQQNFTAINNLKTPSSSFTNQAVSDNNQWLFNSPGNTNSNTNHVNPVSFNLWQ